MRTGIQFLRFGIVGLISNVVLFLLYLVLTQAGSGHKVAMSVLYLVGVAQTFVFNRNWSFRHGGRLSRSFIRYLLLYGAGYLLNLAVLMAFVDSLGFAHQWVQGSMILILAVFLFLGQKYWVFSTGTTPQRE